MRRRAAWACLFNLSRPMENQGGEEDEAGYTYGRIDGGHYFGKTQLAGKEGPGGHEERENPEAGAVFRSEAGDEAVKAADGRGIDFGDEDEGVEKPCRRRDLAGYGEHGDLAGRRFGSPSNDGQQYGQGGEAQAQRAKQGAFFLAPVERQGLPWGRGWEWPG